MRPLNISSSRLPDALGVGPTDVLVPFHKCNSRDHEAVASALAFAGSPALTAGFFALGLWFTDRDAGHNALAQQAVERP